MDKRRVGYVVVAVLLVAGLVLAYFVLRDPGPSTAEPQPAKPARFTWADGTELRADVPSEQLLIARATSELLTAGMFEDALARNGYTVTLTVDQTTQHLGEQVLADARLGKPANLRMALVAVDPKTGRIVAWSGYQPEQPKLDHAQTWANPGQLFAAFDLVAMLRNGHGLGDIYDGTSPRKFGVATISNRDTAPCGTQCTVAEGISFNTVLFDIVFNTVGAPAVARAAVEAGIPAKVGAKSIPLAGNPGRGPTDLNIAIGGGDYEARPVDIASAYATFAANGTRHTPHLVTRVTDPAANVVFEPEADQAATGLAFTPADPDLNGRIARNVTEALLPTAAQFPCGDNRQCAGKPADYGCSGFDGTAKTDNCASWMAGYTPRLATAVWLGTDDKSALRGKDGTVLDSTVPAKAWQKFMAEYLTDKPVEQFPPFVAIGKAPH